MKPVTFHLAVAETRMGHYSGRSFVYMTKTSRPRAVILWLPVPSPQNQKNDRRKSKTKEKTRFSRRGPQSQLDG